MKKAQFIFTFLCFLFLSSKAFSQSGDKEKAYQMALEAIEMMDNGKFDESIKILKECIKLDPDNFNYPYEIAYAHYAQQDYKGAIKLMEAQLKHPNATSQLYQLLGNAYDFLGKNEKALEYYDLGLKKFPDAGELYLEKGNIYMVKQDYNKAITFYEKGIEVDPSYPSNYYRATKLYLMSNDEVWGMLYGEIFMNLERNSKRTSEVSKLLYDTYKREITFTNDTSFSISFNGNMQVDVSSISNGEFKLPFGMIYETNLTLACVLQKYINLESLNSIRTRFLEIYFEGDQPKNYPNVLFDYQKTIQDAGHLEAYNKWLLMKGEEEAFSKWAEENKEKWDAFVEWFLKNKISIDESHRFYRNQY